MVEEQQRAVGADRACDSAGPARRIAAILVLGPALDANYSAVQQDTYDLGKGAKA